MESPPVVRHPGDLAAAIACAVGVIVLAGWVTGLRLLRSGLPGQIEMKANTAICVVALSAAALLLGRTGRRFRLASTPLSAFVVLVAALSTLQYAAHVDLGIDELVIADPVEPGEVTPPGRMALSTALSFVLLGGGALLLSRGKTGVAAPVMTAMGGTIPVFVLVGYLYGVPEWNPAAPHQAMAVITAFALFLIAFALTAADPGAGWFQLLFDRRSYAARLARRTIVAMSSALLILGWLRLGGERIGLYSTVEGLAVASVSAMCLGLVMIVNFTRLLRAEERSRENREDALRRSEARWRAVFEHLQVGMVQTATDGRLLDANPKLHEILGYAPGELATKTWRDITPPEDITASAETVQRLMRGESERVELRKRYVRRDGTQVLARVVAAPVRDAEGQVEYFVTSVEDITEASRAHDILRDTQAALERMVEAKTAELRIERDRLESRTAELQAANAELEAFAYSVSHDLRAPLRSIDGFSQALMEDAEDRLDETSRQHLARIRAAVARMSQLIEDLLTLSRVSRQSMDLREVDLTALAHDAVARIAEGDARSVRTAIRPGLLARGDPRLLALALENLLSNAWKFSSRRDDPLVCVDRTADGEFFVRDNGVGFDMRFAGKLFVPFQRLHRAAEYPGTGIGLATVRRIVRRHGGEIRVQAAPGQGATFYFTLGHQEAPS